MKPKYLRVFCHDCKRGNHTYGEPAHVTCECLDPRCACGKQNRERQEARS